MKPTGSSIVNFNTMTVLLLLFLSLMRTEALAAGGIGEKREPKKYTIEQLMNTTTLSGASFSHDESQIFFSSNKSGIFNVHTIRVIRGKQSQVTFSTTESTYLVSSFPKDTRILYTRDQGGNENNHLYVLDLDGQEKDLTPGEKVKAQFLRWSLDEKSFFFTTNERDPRFFDVYKMNTNGYQRELFFQNTPGYDIGPISNNEKYIALSKPNFTIDSDIYLYNVAKKEMKHITPHKGNSNYNPESFDGESEYLYFLTNQGSDFTYVARYNIESGKSEGFEKYDWDVAFLSFSHKGKYRVIGINEDASTKIKMFVHATNEPFPLPKITEGDITSVKIANSEKQMVFYVNGDRSPNDLYIYDFTTRQLMRLTDSLNPEIERGDLVEAEVVRYKSFDGMEIPALLYKPYQASSDNKLPAIVEVHGGPGGQSRKGYNPLMQYLANHGYVVLRVNNRGSSGYGKKFFAADDKKHGREPLWDCVEAKKYLASLGYVDASKIGIQGGSYGGYMVLAALAFKPEEFAVGVDIFGVSNWVRTLESIPPYWESRRKALYQEIGDPQIEKEMLRAISPLFHADKITKPLMVLQGANDPRVLKSESDEIVEAIKKNKGTVEYILFDNEGHGFTKKANQIQGYKAILDFLNKYLKNSRNGQ
jgi:dipeptidyl aminopeptidase/acylaminoacyl peptidase